jgi:uncharacterized BrkB/YihY/UPF0761 family membrane protein
MGFVYLLLLQIPGFLCLLVGQRFPRLSMILRVHPLSRGAVDGEQIWGILFGILAIFAGLGFFTIYTSESSVPRPREVLIAALTALAWMMAGETWTNEIPKTHSDKQIMAIKYVIPWHARSVMDFAGVD